MRPKHTRSTIATNLPLTPFKKWIEARGKSPRTVENYASLIRNMFQTEKAARELIVDPEALCEIILETDAALAPGSRPPFRSAIRMFDAWIRERGLVSVLPKFPDRRRREVPTALESYRWLAPLLDKIQTEANPDIPWQRVAELKWKHVEGVGGDLLRIRDPGWGRSYIVPKAPMLEIAYWIGNGKPPDTELPIIPREPGSTYPLPAAILRRLSRM